MSFKKLIFLMLVLLLTVSLSANKGINIRAGFLSPSGAKTGFMPGISYGLNVDDVVELAVGFDFFYRSYEETKTVSATDRETGTTVEVIEAGSELKTGYIPVMATLKVGVPVELPVLPYAGVGLGWAILWEDIFLPAGEYHGENDELVEVDKVEELDFYNGFNWILNLGAKYRLSPNVHIYGETFYNFGKMKKDIETGETGRTWDEVDMSGLGLRLGIEMALR